MGKVYLIETMTEQGGACQVGSETDHPCPRRAMVEIRGVPFCDACAREQEAYFAVGRLVAHPQEGRGANRELEGTFAGAGER